MRRTGIGTATTLLFVSAIAMVGWVPPAVATPTTTAVSMKDFKFIPAQVTVHVGDSVKWTYDESSRDLMPNCESVFFQLPLPVNCPGHSTTSTSVPSGATAWNSGVHRAAGFPYSVTFTMVGTYHYICTVHGGPNANNPVTHMEGDIVVSP